MVLVNLQGSGADAFALLRHAAWHGMTLADLVFPWFILAVGLSVPPALDRRADAGVLPLLRRAAVLAAIGIVLGWLIRPTLDPAEVRWAGVLQRIGIVYLACALVARSTRGAMSPAVLALACLVAHAAVLLLVAAPGEAAPSLAMGEGASGWLDRTLVPGRLYREAWDPEGALSTLPAIGTGLIGLALMRWRRAGATAMHLLATAIALVVAGLVASPALPLNKALWTGSYALVAAGTAAAAWLALAWFARSAADGVIYRLLLLAGQTALTLYVLHMLLIALLVRTVPGGGTLWSHSYDALAWTGLPPGVASLLFALAASALSLAPLSWLRRRGLLLKA
jgi:predicted acyltransferase